MHRMPSMFSHWSEQLVDRVEFGLRMKAPVQVVVLVVQTFISPGVRSGNFDWSHDVGAPGLSDRLLVGLDVGRPVVGIGVGGAVTDRRVGCGVDGGCVTGVQNSRSARFGTYCPLGQATHFHWSFFDLKFVTCSFSLQSLAPLGSSCGLHRGSVCPPLSW